MWRIIRTLFLTCFIAQTRETGHTVAKTRVQKGFNSWSVHLPRVTQLLERYLTCKKDRKIHCDPRLVVLLTNCSCYLKCVDFSTWNFPTFIQALDLIMPFCIRLKTTRADIKAFICSNWWYTLRSTRVPTWHYFKIDVERSPQKLDFN